MKVERGNGQARCQRRVWVADDDPVMRLLLDRVVRRVGFEARLFEDAESALAELQAHESAPDLLITDYEMPGMNGLELVAHCRRLAPTAKIISISGALELPELARPECQPDRLLAKPFAPSELIATIHALFL